jgi:hypothetical protein
MLTSPNQLQHTAREGQRAFHEALALGVVDPNGVNLPSRPQARSGLYTPDDRRRARPWARVILIHRGVSQALAGYRRFTWGFSTIFSVDWPDRRWAVVPNSNRRGRGAAVRA